MALVDFDFFGQRAKQHREIVHLLQFPGICVSEIERRKILSSVGS